MCCKWWLILMLMSNLLSISWNIAWMGGGALRCICGRHQPGQLRLERYWGWLFHHMGRKRVPVSYGSNRKRVAECLCWRTNSSCSMCWTVDQWITGYSNMIYTCCSIGQLSGRWCLIQKSRDSWHCVWSAPKWTHHPSSWRSTLAIC